MHLPTTTVVADFTFSDNTEVEDAIVTFKLSEAVIDAGLGEIILPQKVTAGTDADGKISANIWPNSRGRTPTSYSVMLNMVGSNKAIWLVNGLVIPETAATVDLSDLVGQQDLTALAVVYHTQAELDAELLIDPDYMVGKFIYVLESV